MFYYKTFDNDNPKFVQIANHIRELIHKRYLIAGMRLPPQRELAENFKVSRNTINEAIDLLIKEGLLEVKPQSGSYVCFPNNTRPNPWSDFLDRGRHISNENHNRLYHSLSQSSPNNTMSGSEPINDFLADKFLATSVERCAKTLASGGGKIPPLQEAVSEYLKKSNISADPDQILIMPGVMEATNFIYTAFLNHGVTLVYQTPSFLDISSYAKSTGAHMHGIISNGKGITAENLRGALTRKKNTILYLSPVTDPHGESIPMPERINIMKLCANNNIPVIENGKFADLERLDGIYPMKSVNKDEVIHIGSFVNNIYSGLKIAWIVMPNNVIARLNDVNFSLSKRTPLILQQIACEFIVSGDYDKYLCHIYPLLKERKVLTDKLLNDYLSKFAVCSVDKYALRATICFNGNINMKKMYDAALYKGLFFPGYAYNNKIAENIVYFTPTSLTEEELEKNISHLAKIVIKIGS